MEIDREIDPIVEFQVIVGRYKKPRLRKLGNNNDYLIVYIELKAPPNKNSSYT